MKITVVCVKCNLKRVDYFQVIESPATDETIIKATCHGMTEMSRYENSIFDNADSSIVLAFEPKELEETA